MTEISVVKNKKKHAPKAHHRYRENPFTDAIELTGKRKVVSHGSRATLADVETGEVYEARSSTITKIVEVDDERFVKLFTQNLRVFFDLKPSTFKLLEVILHEMQKHKQQDRIYLNSDLVAEYFLGNNIKPVKKTSYQNAMNELETKNFVARSMHQNLWFINPNLFFNGDRASFVTEIRRKRKTKLEQLEEKGQGNFLEEEKGQGNFLENEAQND